MNVSLKGEFHPTSESAVLMIFIHLANADGTEGVALLDRREQSAEDGDLNELRSFFVEQKAWARALGLEIEMSPALYDFMYSAPHVGSKE